MGTLPGYSRSTNLVQTMPQVSAGYIGQYMSNPFNPWAFNAAQNAPIYYPTSFNPFTFSLGTFGFGSFGYGLYYGYNPLMSYNPLLGYGLTGYNPLMGYSLGANPSAYWQLSSGYGPKVGFNGFSGL
jgi:hypothetical protein